MLRIRIDFASVGGVGVIGMFFSDEYDGGGDCVRGTPSCPGIEGASREGGGGVWDETSWACRGGSAGGCDGRTTISVLIREFPRRSEPGLLFNSFMRFVERVRRNCAVRSAAHVSGNGCDEGTGLRRGTPLFGGGWSAMVAVSRSQRKGVW